MTIKDIGPKPQSFDLENATLENTSYRAVAWSGIYLQLTLMSIPVGEDIGLEAHPETDQFLQTRRRARPRADGSYQHRRCMRELQARRKRRRKGHPGKAAASGGHRTDRPGFALIGSTTSGTGMAPRSPPTRASSTWTRCWTPGSRRIVGFGIGEHHDADLATTALRMAVAVRGGKDNIGEVIMHSDQGSEYTARNFRPDRRRPGSSSRCIRCPGRNA